MSQPITLNGQARALRSITALPLAHCKRVLLSCAMERDRTPKRRRTIANRQLEFNEAPATESEIDQCFAEIRRNLQEFQP